MRRIDPGSLAGAAKPVLLAWSLVWAAGCNSSTASGPNPPSGANVYFLNFEGQTLTPGPDDPTLDRSEIVSATSTVPPYLAGDPQRAMKIQAIVDEVEDILAPYDIAVVTSRPTSGTYDMAVAGGASPQIGLPSGLRGVTVQDCAGARPRHISFVFDLATGHEAARQIVGSLGACHRVSASTASTDCMCIADASCTTLTAPCTLGGPGTPVSASLSCEVSGVTTMNVQEKFAAAFGRRL